MREIPSQKVSFGEKIGYSMGDVAANLVFQVMVIFQLKFYTDVFGLEGAIAGSVFLTACLAGLSLTHWWASSVTAPKRDGENIALGYCGQHCLSVYSMSLPSITQE